MTSQMKRDREPSQSMEPTPQQAKERVLPLKCGSFCEKCYEFLVMYCNYEYPGKIKKIEPDTLGLAREMCEKAKTIGDPENQDILNRLCELLERRLTKKKEKDTGGTGKRNAGLEEQHLWQEVDSMKADHLKPDKYMKNKKDFMFEELKIATSGYVDTAPYVRFQVNDVILIFEQHTITNVFAGQEEHHGNMLPQSPPESPSTHIATTMLLPDPVLDKEHPSDVSLSPLILASLITSLIWATC